MKLVEFGLLKEKKWPIKEKENEKQKNREMGRQGRKKKKKRMVSYTKRENQIMNEWKSSHWKEKEKQAINKETSEGGSKTKDTYQIQYCSLQHEKYSPSNTFKFWSLRGA